jgi:SNF2 family DNA or RNA helicase
MESNSAIIIIEYIRERLIGRYIKSFNQENSSIWERLKTRYINYADTIITDDFIETPWPNILDTIREFGSKQFQNSLNFRFQPSGAAIEKIKEFARQISETRLSKNSLSVTLSDKEIVDKLFDLGFKRERPLRPFQIRDIQHLVSLSHGANFSVPGAGKTTVTFAVHLLTKKENQHLFVVGPKAAFPAWKGIVGECMIANPPFGGGEQFTVLDSSEEETDRMLCSGSTRFLMSYDLLVRQQSTISNYMARQNVHLVLDESHRMKAGLASQRGAFLINISSLPVRRDILSGTPMPQSSSDIASQLRFLWPGAGLDLQIQRGVMPRIVLGQRYVRTTKNELGLPKAIRYYYNIDMAPGQLALYSVVRLEALRQLTKVINTKGVSPDYLSARKSIMRLLQLSVNPTLALQGIIKDDLTIESGIVDKVVEEGVSEKMKAVVAHARRLAKDGRKTVIWTIFTGTILELELLIADLNPVILYGAVPSGDSYDTTTREGRLKRFHEDPSCMVMIANPAAAGEGISLHTVCHEAIYLDRSYVSTHYLQSIDRIHRLGLPKDTETNIHIYRTKAPPSVGSIDLSVSRRLSLKINNLQALLDDPDLHEIALDEENADDPIDYNMDLQDLVDLVEELEGHSFENPNEDL